MQVAVDVTYLADTVVLLRYFEAFGRVRRAISVLKKRTSSHEDTIREFRIGRRGLTLGDPLTNFQGVLSGIPALIGKGPDLLKADEA
jgi:circadian clock protein KaiC